MEVTLAALGNGTPETMTEAVREALEHADAIAGAARVLDRLPPGCTENRFPSFQAAEIFQFLTGTRWNRPCIVYSGDTGFWSGTRALLPLLDGAGIVYRVFPGISSVQMMAARLGRPWQKWQLLSAHGRECDMIAAVSRGRPAFVLTDSHSGPALCRELAAAGLATLPVTVGENLFLPDERISRMTAEQAAERRFEPLSVLLAEAAPIPYPAGPPGIPDNCFLRGGVPMTKQEVRAVIPAKLGIRPTDTVWDIGAGTGSVSVELARAARRVYAVECREEACGLVRKNRERFGAWNLTLVRGTAPEAFAELPEPDAVFIGGSGGRLSDILHAVLARNPAVRLCVSAIAVETLAAAVTTLAEQGIEAEVTQIGVSRTKPAGNLHLLTASNPVFLISAGETESWSGC